MDRIVRRFISLIAVSLLCAMVVSAKAAGFRTLEVNGLVVGVWYPSDSPETAGRLGPFDVEFAFDAPLRAGHYQPIVMSHGNAGRMRNHHLTASALADSGFIVIAPKHTPDHLVGSSDGTFKALNWRMQELSHALEGVLQLSEFRHHIDLSRVHALGYSLGSLTVMAAAGAGIDGPSADRHCAQNDDPNFCDALSFIQRWQLKSVRDVTVPDLVRDIPEVHFPLAFINGNVALIAPIGQGLNIQENLFRANRVYVVGLEDDTINVPQFHFERLVRMIPGDRLYGAVLRAGHHYAFIAPFAQRVTDIEDIPVAKDPPGFDRTKFIFGLNAELIEFFHSH